MTILVISATRFTGFHTCLKVSNHGHNAYDKLLLRLLDSV